MKKWYIYYSKQGSTEKCGQYIKNKNQEMIMWNLKDGNPKDVAEDDQVILASGIYIGKINKKVIEFIKELKENNNNKNSILLICGAQEDEKEATIEKNLEGNIGIFSRVVFAGHTYNMKKMNFMEKAIIKKVSGVKSDEDKIKYELLDSLI